MNRNMYDTDVTTWSPQGRLFQVEYAMEAVKQGSATVGICSDKYTVLAALKRSPSELASYYKKVFRIDDHMGIVISGLTADARALTKVMRGACLNHKYVYDSHIQPGRLVADLADRHQRCTQSYVRRPYGVGLLIAAKDANGAHLYQTCPSGNFWELQSMALGARSQTAKTYLEKNFESFPSMTKDELIFNALKALSTCTEAEKPLNADNTTLAVVGEDMDFTMYDGQEVAPLLENFRQQGGDTGGAAAPDGTEHAEGAEETAGGDVDMS
eukprot:gb/GECG01013028.1/.p1 GENE.gb/GECG01013028.1/~~gb/GECG01013028.1/.p1  ORF type:complete len:270 (+),score=34.51 gb/GECG01013028.1/:1-810(+)